MTARIDRTGQRYGRLTVTRYVGKRKWECVCDCGSVCYPEGVSLGRGHTNSCGCYAAARARDANTTHGASKSPAWNAWTRMHQRCNAKPGLKNYAWYGAKGITVCPQWATFEQFYADMGAPPAGTSLDRMDNSKGYSPDNCRWATATEQAHNSRVTKLSDADVLAIRSDERPYKEIAVQYGVSVGHVCKVRSGRFYPRLTDTSGGVRCPPFI
jgi:hypothetical protein